MAHNKITFGIESIDMTPSWKGIMPAIIAMLEDGTDTGKTIAKAELMRMADILDRMIEISKKAEDK